MKEDLQLEDNSFFQKLFPKNSFLAKSMVGGRFKGAAMKSLFIALLMVYIPLIAGGEVIETLSAGPDNPSKKQTAYVQTRFSSSAPQANTNIDGFRCIKTFVQIDQAPKEARIIENVRRSTYMTENLVGSSFVPVAISNTAVKLFKFPLSKSGCNCN